MSHFSVLYRPLSSARARVLLAGLLSASWAITPPAPAFSQNQQAIPIPFSTPVVGVGATGLTVTASGGTGTTTAVCATGILTTGGNNYGDGCVPSQAYLSSASATALGGTLIDSYGDIFIIDTGQKVIRVIYNGSPYVATAITAGSTQIASQAGSAYTPVIPVVGNIYTIAGGLTAALATPYYCGGTGSTSYTSPAGPALKGTDSAGSGCPAQATDIGGGVAVLDSAGNLIFEDGNILRLLCINCAAGTPAYSAYATAYSFGTTAANLKNGYLYRLGAGSGSGGNLYSTPTATVVMNNNTNFLYNEAGLATDSEGNFYFPNSHFDDVQVIYEGSTCLVGTSCSGPLTAIIAATNPGLTTITQGALYIIAGSGCPASGTTATTCATTASGLYPPSGVVATSPTGPGVGSVGTTLGGNAVSGVAVDSSGNIYFNDTNSKIVRVIYGGVAPPVGFTAAGFTNPVVGSVYTILGSGSATAINGVAPLSAALSKPNSLSFDRLGDLLISDAGLEKLIELPASTATATGSMVLLAGGSANANGTAPQSSFCSGATTGPKNFDLFNDGCPATQLKLNNPYGPIASDKAGNLYVADDSYGIVRKLSLGVPQSSNVGTPSATQTTAFGFLSSATLAAMPFTFSSTEFTDAGNDTCTPGLAATTATTCVVDYTFTPVRPGGRSGALTLSGTTTSTLGTQGLSGIGVGAAAAFDPGTVNVVGSTLKPAGIAVDPFGNVLVTDQASNSVFKYINGTKSTVATGYKAPTGVAGDAFGNVFVADASANTVTEITPSTQLVVATGLSSPAGLALDLLGDLYIADSGNNRILFLPHGSTAASTVPVTGLSGPRAVTVDAAGDLFVADTTNLRIVELSIGGTQTALPYSVAGQGVSVDAAGNLYVADSLTSSILEFPAATSYGSVAVAANLTSPQGLAIDGNDNLYLADSGLTQYEQFQRTVGSFTFHGTGTTVIDETNAGNATLIPASSTPYSGTDTTDFTLAGATSNGCSGNLPTGAVCGEAATFTYPSKMVTDTVTFTSNASNGAPLGFVLTGLAPIVQTMTTTTLTASPVMLRATNPVTLSAVVSPAPTNVPLGTVTFSIAGAVVASAKVSASGLATVTTSTLPIGNDAIVATYSGNLYYNTSVSSSFTVVVQPPIVNTSIQIAGVSPPAFVGVPFTINATVKQLAPTPAVLSGTITYMSGMTVLGMAPITGVSGSNTATTSFAAMLPLGNDSITATYNGDANDNPSTSTALIETVYPAFSATPASSTLTITNFPGSASTALTINPGGVTSAIFFYCAGLNPALSCAFTPVGLQLAAGTTAQQTVELTVENVNASLAQQRRPGPIGVSYASLLGFPLTLCWLATMGGRSSRGRARLRSLTSFIALILASGTLIGLSACGSSPGEVQIDPKGSYSFTLQVYGGTTLLQSVPLTVVQQ